MEEQNRREEENGGRRVRASKVLGTGAQTRLSTGVRVAAAPSTKRSTPSTKLYATYFSPRS